MILSEQGVQLIAKFEGTVLHLYEDPTGNCTIAIGHMVHSGPCNGSEPVEFKQGITTQQAYDLLKTDAQKAADCVSAHVTVPLSQPQIDALISFTYNVGCGAFQTSDLLTLLNQGNYAAVPAQLMRWVHGNGVVLPGLVTRRTAEGVLFASQQGGVLLTTILKNFPNGNQRFTRRSDNTIDINADLDCVQQCIADALTWFTGKLFQAGVIKQTLYGYNYQGGTDAHADVGYCAHFGVKLYPIDASAPTLIADIHQQIQQQHPVIITQPDPYMPPGSGWTHCIIMCEEGPGYLVANDPFIAAQITKKDSEWAQDLAVNEIWVLAPIKETISVGITLSTPGIGQYFKAGNGNEWICTNGHTIHGAILTYYMTAFNLPLGGLTGLGLPTSEEVNVGDTAHSERVTQHFEYGDIQYNPQHVGGAQPGAGPVYSIRPVVAPSADITTLQTENAALQAKLDAVRKDVA